MKKLYFLFLLFFTLVAFGQKNPKTVGFIENKGQIVDQKGRENKSVLYLLNTNGLNVQLKKNGFSYDIYEAKKVSLTKKEKELHGFSPKSGKEITTPDYSLDYTYHRIDIDFLNSNSNVQLSAEEKSADYDNYYNVIHAPQGVTNVHKYKKVTYQNIYHQIDVVFFIPKDSTKSVEYNFVVKPGGKVSDIQLKFNGAKTELAENKIKMKVHFGEMEETLPLSWEEHGGERKEIAVGYRKIKKDVYGFEGDVNVSGKTIVIDPTPVRLWGTYYGGSGGEMSGDVEVDNANNVFISGSTGSNTNIATAGTYQSVFTGGAGFIAKFDTNGVRIWGSYYPFMGSMQLDFAGNIYLYGNVLTANPNIPSPGCYQPTKSNYNDGFLIKLNALGFKEWGTYYGGNGNDYIHYLNFDLANNIYLVGETDSTNALSTPGAHQELNGSNGGDFEAFAAKFNPQGIRIWGTFYGGIEPDGFFSCQVSDDNFLYLIGATKSASNIATSGASQSTLSGISDGMLIKFTLDGQRISGTYLGGPDEDILYFSKLVGNSLFLSGRSTSLTGIATPNTFYENYQNSGSMTVGPYCPFIINYNLATGQKEWGTYFPDQIVSIDANPNKEVYFAGETNLTTGIATPNAYMPIKNAYHKVYLIKLNTLGQREWGTYYGGNRAEQVGLVALDNNNDIYLYGNTNGSTTGIATANAQQTTLGSNPDTFLVKFRDCLSSTTATSNSPVCTGSSITLHATGGTNYSWTGPNGFVSTDPNPVINNASASHEGQYSCSITGSGSCDDTVIVTVVVGDTVAPVPNVNTLTTITGDCTTVATVPTATDHCAGVITATTIDPLNYTIPGNYTIHWNYNDGNGNTSTQNQSVVITAIPIPTLPSPQDFCVQETATFNDVTITGQNIQWYDALVGGNLLPGTTPMQHLMNYYASQTINGCESSRASIQINIFSTPPPTGTDQSFCDQLSPTLSDVIVSGTDIRWYATATSTVVLPMTTPLVGNTTYYATQTDGVCESVNRLPITITLINTLNAHDYTEEICDDKNDGKETIVLSDYHDDLIADVTGCSFMYYHSFAGAMGQVASDRITAVNYILAVGLNTVYVRITSSNGCHQVVALNFTLFSKPVIPITDIMPICEGSSITVDAGAGYDYYSWSTGETGSSITVSTPENYSVTVREYHLLIPYCESIKDFTVVKSNIATVFKIVPSDWTVNQNSITVLLTSTSVGDYEYSLDGIHYQDSNTFTGLESGEYTVYVKDKNGCGIQPEDFYLLMYPKFFTPNGDGYNDVWKIELSEKEANLTVKIFDRFGKLLKALDNTMGWNGTFNGQELPSTDYWFSVIRADGKEYRGHFALKR